MPSEPHVFPVPPVRAARDARQVDSASGRRQRLAAAAVGVVAAGLVVTQMGHGPAAGIVGDGLYAVLIYVLVAVVLPRARALLVAGFAVVACAGIEVAQLTGVPATVVEAWPPARYLLGTTFQAVDLAAYAAGAALGCIVDAFAPPLFATGQHPPDRMRRTRLFAAADDRKRVCQCVTRRT